MTFEDQLKALIFFHLEEYVSGSHLVQVLKEDNFARENIAPKDGIEKSSFLKLSIPEALNSWGMYFKIYALKRAKFYLKNMPGLVNLYPLTVL